MMRERLNEFAAMLWGPICTRGNLTGSVAKMRTAAKAPKSTHCNNGGAKDMGSKRQDYGFCRTNRASREFACGFSEGDTRTLRQRIGGLIPGKWQSNASLDSSTHLKKPRLLENAAISDRETFFSRSTPRIGGAGLRPGGETCRTGGAPLIQEYRGRHSDVR